MSSVIEMYEEQTDLAAKARKLEKVSGMSIDALIEYYTLAKNRFDSLPAKFERVNIMTAEEMRALLKLGEVEKEE